MQSGAGFVILNATHKGVFGQFNGKDVDDILGHKHWGDSVFFVQFPNRSRGSAVLATTKQAKVSSGT